MVKRDEPIKKFQDGMLLRADARHLPLRSDLVHCVVARRLGRYFILSDLKYHDQMLQRINEGR